MKIITNRYYSLKKALEERIALSTKYVEFHSFAVTLENEFDIFAKSITNIDSNSEIFDTFLLLKIKQIHIQLVYSAENFINDLIRVIFIFE